jgi:Bacterial archaeo-eukaryotic release factor family 2
MGVSVDTTPFRSLLGHHGPFASIYFDIALNVPDGQERMDATWQDIRRALLHQGADNMIIATLEPVVRRELSLPGPRGVIAGADGVHIAAAAGYPRSGLPVTRVSQLPYVLPLINGDLWHPSYLFVALDREGAELTTHHHQHRIRRETLLGEGFPVHKAATAGWNGYGDFQHSVEEAVRINIRAVAARVAELADHIDAAVIFVSGQVRTRAELMAELPKRLTTSVVALPCGASGKRLADRDAQEFIDEVLRTRHATEIQHLTNTFTQERGNHSGRAVDGLRSVCAALRDGNVETLLIGQLGAAPVLLGTDPTTVATDADTLSDLGQAASAVVSADEALPFAAIAGRSAIEYANCDLTLADGVGAILRHRAIDYVPAGGHDMEARR